MTGAGQVCWTSSLQESRYTQREPAAPPHQTQPYLGSAVRHRLQSCRPTEQLNRVTETRQRKRSLWGNDIILMSSNVKCLSPHHTDPPRCRCGICFFSSRWSWLRIPPSGQNRHTGKRRTTSISTTCDMAYELMLCTLMCKAVTACVKLSGCESSPRTLMETQKYIMRRWQFIDFCSYSMPLGYWCWLSHFFFWFIVIRFLQVSTSYI